MQLVVDDCAIIAEYCCRWDSLTYVRHCIVAEQYFSLLSSNTAAALSQHFVTLQKYCGDCTSVRDKLQKNGQTECGPSLMCQSREKWAWRQLWNHHLSVTKTTKGTQCPLGIAMAQRMISAIAAGWIVVLTPSWRLFEDSSVVFLLSSPYLQCSEHNGFACWSMNVCDSCEQAAYPTY